MRSASWVVLGALAACVVALLVALPPGWIAGAEGALAAWRGWLGAARVGAIVAAWIWWDALVDRLPAVGPDEAAYLRRRRRFWVGALVAVEAVLVRNLFGAVEPRVVSPVSMRRAPRAGTSRRRVRGSAAPFPCAKGG